MNFGIQIHNNEFCVHYNRTELLWAHYSSGNYFSPIVPKENYCLPVKSNFVHSRAFCAIVR
jgi:hypothetical protein